MSVDPRPVALVTSTAFADHDDDLSLLAQALRIAGRPAEVVGWDAPVEWERFEAAIIRSTWDYLDRRDEFLAWSEDVAERTRLANPPDVLRWNTDKRYLIDLEQAGVPIVPTLFVAPGDELPEIGWDDVVVKPAISAGGRLTGRYVDAPDEALAFVRRLLGAGHYAMVQPHLPSVEAEGEIDVVTFGGQPSHAVTKSGILGAGMLPVEDYRLAVSQVVELADLRVAPLDLVGQVLDALPGGGDALLYARIDCAVGLDGTAVLMEAELVEPSFFIALASDGAPRFAAALELWLAAGVSPGSG